MFSDIKVSPNRSLCEFKIDKVVVGDATTEYYPNIKIHPLWRAIGYELKGVLHDASGSETPFADYNDLDSWPSIPYGSGEFFIVEIHLDNGAFLRYDEFTLFLKHTNTGMLVREPNGKLIVGSKGLLLRDN